MNMYKKVIWITGASSGIGAALAVELSKLDCQLILSARNRDGLINTKANCFGHQENIAILPFDLEVFDAPSTRTC